MLKTPAYNLSEYNKSAGLYIHIPYCKRKCSYCNFHFSTNLTNKTLLIEALLEEIAIRAEEVNDHFIQSIYFGGGTPSLLTKTELKELLNTIRSCYTLDPQVEISLEANPDDLSLDYLMELKTLGINRLSIGVQSFFDTQLEWMNRAHIAKQSFESIEFALKSGFTNLSVDLMYGLPNLESEIWLSNLKIIAEYKIPHISCYALTVEERTDLSHKINNNSIRIPDDSNTVDQMDVLLNFCDSNHYEAYEISNFAKAGYRSKHNSAYWEGIPYLGFGPAAHSYDKESRRWNIANNELYIQCIKNKAMYYQTEKLTNENRCNEYLMLQLRRIEGLSLQYIETHHNDFLEQIKFQLNKQMEKNNIIIKDGHYILSRQGKYIADEVSANLFV